MRPDMGKCVIEAPRRGSSARSYKARHYGKIIHTEDGPDYEGLTRIPSRMGDDKSFSDKLGPLYRYLHANVGRRWDDVYSEIAYHIGRYTRSEGLRHIISAHLPVATSTWRGVSGKLYVCDEHGESEIKEYFWHRAEFYVEPSTCILREAPWKKLETPAVFCEVIPIAEGKEYRIIDGIWYYLEYEEIKYKVFLRSIRGNPRSEDRTLIVVSHKKQLNRKELKAHGLRNGVAPMKEKEMRPEIIMRSAIKP